MGTYGDARQRVMSTVCRGDDDGGAGPEHSGPRARDRRDGRRSSQPEFCADAQAQAGFREQCRRRGGSTGRRSNGGAPAWIPSQF